MYIGDGNDPFQEAVDLIEEYQRRKGKEEVFGTGGFTTISSNDPQYINLVIDEIRARGYIVRTNGSNGITISEARTSTNKRDGEDR